MVLLALPPADHLWTNVCARARDAGRRAQLRITGAAAQTRMVSVARIRLVSRKSPRLFKGIICDDISEFECSLSRRAGRRAQLRITGVAALTRLVSVARIRLVSRKSPRLFKGIICDDISEFESSLSGRVGVKRFQTAPSILVLMSLAGILASLRDRHPGPPMMGSEGCGGPISRYVLAVILTAGIKTRNGLASSIVPAGTSLHRVGGIQFSPIAIVHN